MAMALDCLVHSTSSVNGFCNGAIGAQTRPVCIAHVVFKRHETKELLFKSQLSNQREAGLCRSRKRSTLIRGMSPFMLVQGLIF